jgi:hypothetical protein
LNRNAPKLFELSLDIHSRASGKRGIWDLECVIADLLSLKGEIMTRSVAIETVLLNCH